MLFWLLSNCQAKWIKIVISRNTNEVTICMLFPTFTDVILVFSFLKPFKILFASSYWSYFYHMLCRVIIPCFFLTDKKHFWKEKIGRSIYSVTHEERSVYWEVLTSVTVRKKVHMNMYLILNRYQCRAVWIYKYESIVNGNEELFIVDLILI